VSSHEILRLLLCKSDEILIRMFRLGLLISDPEAHSCPRFRGSHDDQPFGVIRQRMRRKKSGIYVA